ncbi:phytoene desaturase family protein [Streptomyces sp. NPDC002990]
MIDSHGPERPSTRQSGAIVPQSVRVGRPLHRGGVEGEYDAIVVGSGAGGLTSAVCLAKQGRRVAVFEQHYTAGGYTHAYRRHGWEWDVGIHYVGQLRGREPMRVLSDYLTDGTLRWASLGDPFDEYRLGGDVFSAPVGYDAYRAMLVERFPAERAGIDELFGRISRCRTALPFLALRRLSGRIAQRAARLLERTVPEYALRPAREVVGELTADRRLQRAVLSPTALLMADSTTELPFLMLAVMFEHFRTGAWYPVGGSARIAGSMLAPIRRSGGEVFVRAPVRSIEVAAGRASGVVLADGTLVRAPVVISNAGARNTFGTLLPEPVATAHGYPPLLARARDGHSFVVLFLGLDGSPAELGLPRTNVLVLEDEDCDTFYHQAPESGSWLMSGLFVSFASAKDPTWTTRHPGRSTGEVLAYVRPEWFADSAGTSWNRRGHDYRALKDAVCTELLDTLYRHVPQIRGKVVYQELGTPLTAEHFGRWPNGSLYGLAKDRENLLRQDHWLRPRTRVPGLYLSGQDSLAGGLIGAVGGGLLAAHEALDTAGRVRLWRDLALRAARGPARDPDPHRAAGPAADVTD